jgi:N,N'-diacetyllegionaminate synthase
MHSERTLIIAEIGVNHNGSVELAKELIQSAKNCGADIVKFQTWITEEIVDVHAPKADYQIKNDTSQSQFEMLKKLELSFKDFKELKAYAKKLDVEFLSTPDDEKSLNFLVDELGMELIKIGSGEVTNLPFLEKVGKKNLPVILSTGMSYLGEVETAYYTLLSCGAKEVTLLHCTSDYPASLCSVNLKAMQTLKTAFNCKIGYSDHTEGIEVSIAAVCLGAGIIEKHFTLDKNLPGPDHKASLQPEEFKLLVDQIRNVELSLSGDGRKIPSAGELATKAIVQRGIYAKTQIAIGEKISMENLIFKRPVDGGIPVNEVRMILNRTVNKNIEEGGKIYYKDLA